MNVFETLPPISPRMGFLRTVSGWLDAALVEFGPEGTMHYAQSALQGGAENLFTSGMEERQVIFGDTRPLEDALRAVDAARAPGLLFLTSSPVSEIIGADLEQVRRQLQPGLRARLSVWDRVPVQGTEQDGQRPAGGIRIPPFGTGALPGLVSRPPGGGAGRAGIPICPPPLAKTGAPALCAAGTRSLFGFLSFRRTEAFRLDAAGARVSDNCSAPIFRSQGSGVRRICCPPYTPS